MRFLPNVRNDVQFLKAYQKTSSFRVRNERELFSPKVNLLEKEIFPNMRRTKKLLVCSPYFI